MLQYLEIKRIPVAVPDGKHIFPVIEEVCRNAGLRFEDWKKNGRLHANVLNAPVDLVRQNHSDIVRGVDTGTFAAGFVGSDRLDEYKASLPEGQELNIEQVASFSLFSAQIRLSVLVREKNYHGDSRYKDPIDLSNRRVITTYPGLSRNFFTRYFSDPDQMPAIDGEVTGKEEGQVAARIAEAAVVIVDKGTAMRANSLRELAVVMREIQPVLIYNPRSVEATVSEQAWRQFLGRFQAISRITESSQIPQIVQA